jgi:S-methylmethionine-dependent homocysteine/selenocysteine methylase
MKDFLFSIFDPPRIAGFNAIVAASQVMATLSQYFGCSFTIITDNQNSSGSLMKEVSRYRESVVLNVQPCYAECG